MDLAQLWQRLETRYDDFPPKLREAATYVRENPSDIALHSLRRIAREAAVSPGTLLRFVQSLGFPGWEEFQNLHRDWLTEANGAVYSGRADSTLQADGPDTLIAQIAEAEAANAVSGLHPEQRARLNAAAAMLSRGRTVAVLGLRSCHAVACSLAYSLSLFHPGTRLMAATGGMLLDSLHTLRPGDVLVAISVAPYSRETVEAARFAQNAGLEILALTDAPLGPVARLADVTLTATNGGPAHLASVTGLVSLSQALACLTLASRGAAGLDALRRYEASLATRSSFLPPES
ncbi:MurR/RpiR family transcriptional regulator [Paenirhodobacter populi]|uniref:MurR/RpiR family transcriptional regulator n=1 Tax=Paenirhodobacter populi TaxID=2306993 RepID=A0A443J6H8_9RHOB|nr:MurR/RpiR family transcriptional regulator [Sinirhodobacter populi]RWR16158.1 MurR/RpiR family transcriptional regulator [Sinirhodobacter populi]